MTTQKTTYQSAGVNIDEANALVEDIKVLAKKTATPAVMKGIGGFGALYDLSSLNYEQPVLVSGTDGVGTKLKLAIELGKHDTIGIDLVAMCVNDIITCGAKPLFFLDYYATGKLERCVAAEIIKGIAKGCELSDCALIGGETAELPGMYQDKDYDLAGFTVGAVEKTKIIDGSTVKNGDVLIGIASSGPHSNGYSLIRKILKDSDTKLNMQFENSTIGDILLTPTILYTRIIEKLIKQFDLHAISHITGGGIPENLPRVLPDNMQAVIQHGSWKTPEIFTWLGDTGDVDSIEMFRTFNMGIGLIMAVDKNDADAILKAINATDLEASQIGRIQASDNTEVIFES